MAWAPPVHVGPFVLLPADLHLPRTTHTVTALTLPAPTSFLCFAQTGFLGFAPFDPLNMRSEEMKLKELKNGRLVRQMCGMDGGERRTCWDRSGVGIPHAIGARSHLRLGLARKCTSLPTMLPRLFLNLAPLLSLLPAGHAGVRWLLLPGRCPRQGPH